MEHRHSKMENLQYQNQSSHLSLILEETKQKEIERCKSKKGASVSEALALFDCSSSRVDLVDHSFEIRFVNIKKIV